MAYTVKEIFYTLQGEGRWSGRAAVFCRFSGCNLWNGIEKDRASALCSICDTDFVGGSRYEGAVDLANGIENEWPMGQPRRMVVLTGGEPALQIDAPLIAELQARRFFVALETNGTMPIPAKGIDWLCVSPKPGTELKVQDGHELKLVYPQPGAEPERYARFPFINHTLSPLDNSIENARLAAAYCLEHPQWRLTTQMHKTVGFA